MRKKKYNRLIEQRKEIRVALTKALAEDDMVEYHRRIGQITRIDNKLRKEAK